MHVYCAQASERSARGAVSERARRGGVCASAAALRRAPSRTWLGAPQATSQHKLTHGVSDGVGDTVGDSEGEGVSDGEYDGDAVGDSDIDPGDGAGEDDAELERDVQTHTGGKPVQTTVPRHGVVLGDRLAVASLLRDAPKDRVAVAVVVAEAGRGDAATDPVRVPVTVRVPV